MNLAAAVNARLTADATVSALIGTRLYPEYTRQADRIYPLAVYKVESVSTQMSHSGATGLVSAQYIVAAIAPTHAAANQLADAIQTALNGKRWSDTGNAVNVQGCFLADDGRREDVITQPATEQVLYYVNEATFDVWHNAL